MNKKVLEALKGSVKKWDKIVKSTSTEDRGTNNCPLCKVFNIDLSCKGCPVYDKVKMPYCKKTPYAKWSKHQEAKHPVDVLNYFSTSWRRLISLHRVKDCKECLQIAKEELNFLKSLLPKNDKKVIL